MIGIINNEKSPHLGKMLLCFEISIGEDSYILVKHDLQCLLS